jgi:hypothetical protein
VHRIGRPDHHLAFTLHRAHERRKLVADFLRTDAHDQCQPARFVFRVVDVDQAQQVIGLHRRTALQAERILDAARVFDVRMIVLPRAVADP